jgi:hypothetical protein
VISGGLLAVHSLPDNVAIAARSQHPADRHAAASLTELPRKRDRVTI